MGVIQILVNFVLSVTINSSINSRLTYHKAIFPQKSWFTKIWKSFNYLFVSNQKSNLSKGLRQAHLIKPLRNTKWCYLQLQRDLKNSEVYTKCLLLKSPPLHSLVRPGKPLHWESINFFAFTIPGIAQRHNTLTHSQTAPQLTHNTSCY